MAATAFLDLEGATAEVISFSYSFSRETDPRKSRPVTTTRNGRIKISLYSESREMIGQIIKWLNTGEAKPEGFVKVFDDNSVDGVSTPLKKITFKNAYVVDYVESLESYSENANMIETFEIASENIVVEMLAAGEEYAFEMQWA